MKGDSGLVSHENPRYTSYQSMLKRIKNRRKKNTCSYWDCQQPAPEGSLLCPEHYEGWTEGLIDRCPRCGRFKDVMYEVCQDCYAGRPVKSGGLATMVPAREEKTATVKLSDVWVDGYMRPDRYFVYLLEFDDGSFYVGHTKDLSKELAKHREQKTSSSARSKPKLQYAQVIATERAAELRKSELKELIVSNPEQIRLMIADFHRHMREFGSEEYA